MIDNCLKSLFYIKFTLKKQFQSIDNFSIGKTLFLKDIWNFFYWNKWTLYKNLNSDMIITKLQLDFKIRWEISIFYRKTVWYKFLKEILFICLQVGDTESKSVYIYTLGNCISFGINRYLQKCILSGCSCKNDTLALA